MPKSGGKTPKREQVIPAFGAFLRRAREAAGLALSQFDGAIHDADTASMTRPKRPRDPNQLAKMITDLTTRTTTEADPNEGKDAKAMARGRLGGVKGGRVRADRLSDTRRAEIARKAAAARWKGRKKQA